ncbi:MAG: VCBS repeat-containing protein [Verrucomicrobiales bacterium]|nr:VCBS repeat-containing protein [Verrucomicrobiales bacterium]
MKTIGTTIFASLLFVTATTAPAEWKRHTIDASDKESGKLGADGVRLADANGDGLMDVVTGWENGDAIRFCLNPGPANAKEVWPGVTVGRIPGAEDAVFADLDGDGALDVVSCCEGKTKAIFFHWAPAEKDRYLDAEAWKMEELPAGKKADQAWMYCLPFDVNRDGALDLIVGSKNAGGTMSWLKNPGNDSARDLTKWKLTKICGATWIMSIRETDLDGDKNPDIVFSDRKSGKSGVFWLKTKAKAPYFEPKILLGCEGQEVLFLDIADINADDRLDIAVAIRKDKIGYLVQPETNPESGNWPPQSQTGGIPQDRFGGAKAVRIADLNFDGNLDVAFTCEGANGDLSGCGFVSLYTGPLAGELAVHDIGGPEGVKFDRIELIDLDNDGDLDLMSCEERDQLGVFWYENPAK